MREAINATAIWTDRRYPDMSLLKSKEVVVARQRDSPEELHAKYDLHRDRDLTRLAIGGTKLLVRVEDAERARTLIDEAGMLSSAGARPAKDVEIPESEWSAQPPEPPPEEAAESHWSGPRVLFVLAVLVAAAYALLDESRRPRWPPWGP